MSLKQQPTKELPTYLFFNSLAMYRLLANSSDVRSKFARIPAHPLSYAEARELVLRAYSRDLNDENTRAAINMTAPINNVAVRLVTNSRVDMLGADINNIILTIRGEIEPGTEYSWLCNTPIFPFDGETNFMYLDRYVIVGAHFDSWPDGALDPGGATCVLLELARTFNELYNQSSTFEQRLV